MQTIHITKSAVRNHEELFPNLESKLQKTDPEFIELFDNWAFDEVIRQSQLDTRTRVMMILVSTIEAARSDILSYRSIKWSQRRDSHSRGTICPAVYEAAAICFP
ncbi:MAG: hypothetical protein NT154_01315 [Verrucomicrobia bacterium]|nr:hypothetical protein [Verrucomicrobiota bacterium]